jgi:hypothetical protein
VTVEGHYSWLYLTTGQKQHIIRHADLAKIPMQHAVCGKGVLTLLPAPARWQADPEGLAERGKCKQCLAILERGNNVQER